VVSAALTDLAGQWTLDPAHSSVTLSQKNMWGLVTVKGNFGTISGAGEVGADGVVSGHLSVDATSVDTKNKKRDIHLRSADFFNVDTHASFTYTVNSVAPTSEGAFAVEGTLEVIGQRHPLTLQAQVHDASGSSVTVVSTAVVDRADFGMTWNKMGAMKGPTTLEISATFTKAGA
jgi:polyisoprenoid-binding protein YceI